MEKWVEIEISGQRLVCGIEWQKVGVRMLEVGQAGVCRRVEATPEGSM